TAGPQLVFCTGASGPTFTGCSGGAGTLTTGGAVSGKGCSAATDAIFLHNPTLWVGDYYYPNGTMRTQGSPDEYGALFGDQYLQGSGNFTLHYDKASAGSDLICPTTTGNGCTTCLDCSNQACNCGGTDGVACTGGSGTCGGCKSDAACCAPLRCVIPNGSSTGTCRFTSF